MYLDREFDGISFRVALLCKGEIVILLKHL